MTYKRKPAWLKKDFRLASPAKRLIQELKHRSLATVCEEAACPNRGECFSNLRMSFLILGPVCTRNCLFCGIAKGMPRPIDRDEPYRLAQAVVSLKLSHAVITSVTRDDLPDGGAAHFCHTVAAIRSRAPSAIVEILIPDFKGNSEAISLIAHAGADIINHNIETVPRLYSRVRPQAEYIRSLRLFERIKTNNPSVVLKSGMMVGLGESQDEIYQVLNDLRQAGCVMITIGQYLPPTRLHFPALNYVSPNTFTVYTQMAKKLGFSSVLSGPFVRSSYGAEAVFKKTTSYLGINSQNTTLGCDASITLQKRKDTHDI